MHSETPAKSRSTRSPISVDSASKIFSPVSRKKEKRKKEKNAGDPLEELELKTQQVESSIFSIHRG